MRTLKGFARIALKSGESRTLSFPLGFEELSFYNAKAQSTVEPDTDYTVYIGGSSTTEQGPNSVLRSRGKGLGLILLHDDAV